MRAPHSHVPTSLPITTYVERLMTPATAASREVAEAQRCDVCEAVIEGEPAGHGSYLWTRGEERRVELVPLCELCAGAINVSAAQGGDEDEEDE